MATERPGPKMTTIIQIEWRNSRRDPHGELGNVRGPSLLEKFVNMTKDPLERERQESEYWARIWEKSLDPHK